MDSLSETSLEAFAAALTPERLRRLQLIYAVLGLCVLLEWGLAAALHVVGPVGDWDGGMPPVQTIGILSGVHGVLFAASLVCGSAYAARQLSPERLRKAVELPVRRPNGKLATGPAAKCVAVVQRALHVRLFSLYGPASFGGAVGCVAAVMGVLRVRPVFWLNAASAVPFLVLALRTFPTADRLKAIFVERIAGA